MRFLPFLAVAVVLSGCIDTSPSAVAPEAPAPEAAAGQGFSCADGTTLAVTYPTMDTARLVRDGRTIEMKIALSADGARYTGGGWEWWAKGMTQGTLSPLKAGEDIASATGVACTAT